ncbi:serine hydrolase domain-containing protein [Marinomonas posidonica]|uniref:Beta-lactamase n=1 Tax=Marinomonas posidonica (strain CECT 7376 / NCIMB 14433 / IVIA-Po-181) TaxID=491952 RepID=F6CWP5_MARPP|nr:serine hydrolase [Marinomonas posidonica]AEF54395.1 beta-lactamase [Marinomonas posidonica IVIA-Po-181]
MPRIKHKVLIWVACLCTLILVVLVYLIQTGGRDRSRESQPVRFLDITRIGAADSQYLGWDPNGLDEVFGYLATLSSDTLVIVTKGQTVASFGDLKTPYRTHPIRKAFLSALVGQHIGPNSGQIRLDARLQDLGIDDTPQSLTHMQKQATVKHLLKSTSGINHPAAAGGGFVNDTNLRLGVEQNKPGTVWAYNNWDYNALTTIFEERTGWTIAEGFQIGIARPTLMKDFTLNSVSYISEPELSQHKAAAFRMSAGDLIKFGQLYLDNGQMNNQQIIPSSWIDRITTDFTKTGRDDLRWGHGYLWWIPNPETGLPTGSFWAWGLGNQAIFVIPEWETVIVHQSDTTEFLNRFMPMIEEGQEAEAAIEQLVLSCVKRDNRKSEYCIEHRFTTRREFNTLISLIIHARI